MKRVAVNKYAHSANLILTSRSQMHDGLLFMQMQVISTSEFSIGFWLEMVYSARLCHDNFNPNKSRKFLTQFVHFRNSGNNEQPKKFPKENLMSSCNFEVWLSSSSSMFLTVLLAVIRCTMWLFRSIVNAVGSNTSTVGWDLFRWYFHDRNVFQKCGIFVVWNVQWTGKTSTFPMKWPVKLLEFLQNKIAWTVSMDSSDLQMSLKLLLMHSVRYVLLNSWCIILISG